MNRSLQTARLLAAGAATALLALPAMAGATPVIVDLAPGADGAAVAASVGAVPEVVFNESGAGFAADLTPAQQARLQRAGVVRAIATDRIVAHISGRGTPIPEQPAQVIRSAQRRVGLLESRTADVDGLDDRRVNIDIAIFDSGIDPLHPDLNVVGGVDCAVGRGWNDVESHGTMVAGFAGAIDNGIGIAGIAPGARLWSVRIADETGFIRNSAWRCGLEWLNRHAKKIEVANWSFGDGDPMVGPCGVVNGRVVDRLHNLTCKAVDAGVTIVAGAGNESTDVGLVSPGAWPEVITASAVAETDGLPGGLGPTSSCFPDQLDDAFAFFSNFGPAVDIAAPGVCMQSTYPGGLYAVNSGTSFSTPFVSGAAGLIKAKRPYASPTAVRTRLLDAAEPGPIAGDPDAFPEGLLNVAGF